MSWKDQKKFVSVLNKRMAYVEMGEGDTTFLFLHGNPTSSYLWREVMPELADQGRCIAPDLIGMGDSEKYPGHYRFVDHAAFLDAFIETVIPQGPIVLVIHDWGSALGFHWAYRHQERVKAIAYMEGVVMPVAWSDWPDAAHGIFQAMRSEAGEDIILNKNVFIERILPASILRKLSAEEMTEYRRPFLNPGEDRRPTLTWPREIPIEGEPADVHAIVRAYGDWLKASDVPKLFINADPGSILIGRQREFCRTWPNQSEVTVKGLHFIQEDSGPEIGQHIRKWVEQ